MKPFELPFDEPAPPDPPSDPPPKPLPEPPAVPAPPGRTLRATEVSRRVHTVTELTARLRTLLESSFAEVWVEGELSNCRLWNTGHLYFTLKDAHAQIKGVMFRTALQRLRFTPKD